MSRFPALLIYVILTVSMLTACSDEPQQLNRQQRTQRVLVEPVELSSERTRLEAVGTSRAFRSVTLYPATSGEVVAVSFKSGQYVTADSVLLELDQRNEKLAVKLAEFHLEEAQRLFNRYQRSADSGATLPTTLDAANTALEAARIELDRALINLEDRTITAPFAGYVGITDVEPGDRVQQATPVTTLDDRSSLLVSFAVPELLIEKIHAGDKLAISTWNMNAVHSFGDVIEIDSRINPETRTFITRARVNNPEDALRPGMSFRVILDLQGEPYPVLAEIALQWGAEGSYIWTVENDAAHRVPVSIVQRQKGRVLVKADLHQGDLVVIEGIQRLRSGVSVEPEIASSRDLAPDSSLDNGKPSGPG